MAFVNTGKCSVGSQIGFFKNEMTCVTAYFSVACMYEVSSVQDEFQSSVFIACRKLKTLYLTLFNPFR